MGMKAARGLLFDVPGDAWACFWFSFLETLAARVVLPDPGIPETANSSLFDAGAS